MTRFSKRIAFFELSITPYLLLFVFNDNNSRKQKIINLKTLSLQSGMKSIIKFACIASSIRLNIVFIMSEFNMTPVPIDRSPIRCTFS